MLHACAPTTMRSPGSVAEDAPPTKPRRHELAHAAVPTIRQYVSVLLAEPFDDGSAVVDRVIAIAGPPGGDRQDSAITATNQHLRVARPAVVLRSRRPAVISSRNQRAIEYPRPASVGRCWAQECGQVRRYSREDAVGCRLRYPETRRQSSPGAPADQHVDDRREQRLIRRVLRSAALWPHLRRWDQRLGDLPPAISPKLLLFAEGGGAWYAAQTSVRDVKFAAGYGAELRIPTFIPGIWLGAGIAFEMKDKPRRDLYIRLEKGL